MKTIKPVKFLQKMNKMQKKKTTSEQNATKWIWLRERR